MVLVSLFTSSLTLYSTTCAMGCIQNKGAVHAYYEPNGELVQFTYPSSHNPNDELVFVSSQDTKQFQPMDECYVLSAAWLAKWLDFAMKKKPLMPGPIPNNTLLNFDNTLLPNVKPKVDYRPVNKAVWEYLFKLYGGGPVITFKSKNVYIRYIFINNPCKFNLWCSSSWIGI